MLNYFRQRIKLLKNDEFLIKILILLLLLLVFHICYSFYATTQYQSYIRAGNCFVISILIFFFGRKGLSYGFTFYACILVYFNTFYNYGSILLLLISIGANPTIKNKAFVLYLINVIIAFSIRKLLVFAFAIHSSYIILFYLCTKYVFSVKTPEKLNLTEDEKMILREMLMGKLQKEIDLFSQTTITAKLKNARERNMCKTTSELLSKYVTEIKGVEKIEKSEV